MRHWRSCSCLEKGRGSTKKVQNPEEKREWKRTLATIFTISIFYHVHSDIQTHSFYSTKLSLPLLILGWMSLFECFRESTDEREMSGSAVVVMVIREVMTAVWRLGWNEMAPLFTHFRWEARQKVVYFEFAFLIAIPRRMWWQMSRNKIKKSWKFSLKQKRACSSVLLLCSFKIMNERKTKLSWGAKSII